MRVLLGLMTLGLISCSAKSTMMDTSESEYEGDDPGECSDGADNDQDGFFDCADNECMMSPDCEETPGTPGGTPGGTTGGTTPTGTTPTDCEGPLCDFISMQLIFGAEFDWDTAAEAFGGVDCYVEFGGEGDFHAVEGNYLVFAGTWDERSDDCSEAFGGDLIRNWAGGAFHTFYFTTDATVLLDWYAHRDEGEYSTEGDPVFYSTEMDLPFDPAKMESSIEWSLTEDLVDPTFPIISLGTMVQTLTVEFMK